VSPTPEHHVDHREEAISYLDAAWERGKVSDGKDRAIPIQQAAAITHAILFVGDELRAIRESVTTTGGTSLADAVAVAVDHATTEVANAARSFAEHGGGWRGR